MIPAIHITGIGIATSAGWGVGAQLEALVAGRAADAPGAARTISFSPVAEESGHGGKMAMLARQVGASALVDAGLDSDLGPAACAYALGGAGLCCPAGLEESETGVLRAILRFMSDAGGRSVPHIIGCGLNSSIAALQWGYESIRAGSPAAVVGTVDLVSAAVVGGLHCRHLLTRNVPRPMDTGRDGLIPGEAAVALVLEPDWRVAERGTMSHGQIRGLAMRRVADPSFDGLADAWREVMAMAHAEEGEYVSAAAAGLVTHDLAELRAIAEFCGTPSRTKPVSAVAGQFGYCLGSSGLLQLALTLLSLGRWFLPATVGLVKPVPEYPVDHVMGKNRPVRVDSAVVNSSGLDDSVACVTIIRSAV